MAYPSIDDLMKKGGGGAGKPASSLRVSSKKTEEQFEEKMDQIKKKELETEAKRSRQLYDNKYSYIDLNKFPVSQEALRQIPKDIAEKLKLVCFYADTHEIRLGALDPGDEAVHQYIKEIEKQRYLNSKLYLISQISFNHVLDLYRTLPIVKPITKDVTIEQTDLQKVQASIKDFSSVEQTLKQKTTTDILTIILGAAFKLGASDVHVETEEEQIVVRYRIDGILHDVAELDVEIMKKLISRVKLLSSLKINIRNKPQDGRFTIKFDTGDVDVRVSVIPTVYGESVVMRLLMQNREGLLLDDLGFRGAALELLREEIQRPNGMILTTGPTGSGKTTTLYAIMQMLNKPGVKIITLEDPVEYRLEGINQSQIDRSKDYTFAKGLRSLLRQDPDIVMVGEIRDLETGDIAVQASLTGHLMLSTVHTNSAAGAIPRLLAMGIKPFLLSPALNVVIGQRLVRKIAEGSRKEKPLEEFDQATQDKILKILDSLPEQEKAKIADKPKVFYEPVAENSEDGIGYKGRIGIFEVFRMTEELEKMIAAGQIAEAEVASVIRKDGMLTMAQDGLLKALDGLTSVEEVFRVSD